MSMIKNAWKATSPIRRKKFNSTRLTGVEWEYNSCLDADGIDREMLKHLKAWRKKWKGERHYDGSCGNEMVTPPLSGDYIAQCLNELGTAFARDNAEFDATCSIHVHVNVKDFSWADMYRLLWVYSRLEKILFQLAGKQRWHSQYCRPCGQDYRKALINRFMTKSKADIKQKIIDVGSQNRYRALNIQPWLYERGSKTTVEFRLHQYAKADEKRRVIQWTQLLVQLVDWVKKHTDQQAKKLPNNALLALCAIAPKSRRWVRPQANKWGKEVFQM